MSIPIINVIVTDFVDTSETCHLDIVANQEIKTLLSKGLNFRVQKLFNADSTYNTILSAVELYIIKLLLKPS